MEKSFEYKNYFLADFMESKTEVSNSSTVSSVICLFFEGDDNGKLLVCH